MFGIFDSKPSSLKLYPCEIEKLKCDKDPVIDIEEYQGILLGVQGSNSRLPVGLNELKRVIDDFNSLLFSARHLSSVINTLIVVGKGQTGAGPGGQSTIYKAGEYKFEAKTKFKNLQKKSMSPDKYSGENYFIAAGTDQSELIWKVKELFVFLIYKYSFHKFNAKNFIDHEFVKAAFMDWSAYRLTIDFYDFSAAELSKSYITDNKLNDSFFSYCNNEYYRSDFRLDMTKCFKTYLTRDERFPYRKYRNQFFADFFMKLRDYRKYDRIEEYSACNVEDFQRRPYLKGTSVDLFVTEPVIYEFEGQVSEKMFNEKIEWQGFEKHRENKRKEIHEKEMEEDRKFLNISDEDVEVLKYVLTGIEMNVHKFHDLTLYGIAKAYVHNDPDELPIFMGPNERGIANCLVRDDIVPNLDDSNITNALKTIAYRDPKYMESINSEAWSDFASFIYSRLSAEKMKLKELRIDVAMKHLKKSIDRAEKQPNYRRKEAATAMKHEPTPQKPSSPQVETKVLTAGYRDMQSIINRQQEEGWQLKSTTVGNTINGNVMNYLLTFERVKPEIKSKTGTLEDRLFGK